VIIATFEEPNSTQKRRGVIEKHCRAAVLVVGRFTPAGRMFGNPGRPKTVEHVTSRAQIRGMTPAHHDPSDYAGGVDGGAGSAAGAVRRIANV
jgi:hypothetical protein